MMNHTQRNALQVGDTIGVRSGWSNAVSMTKVEKIGKAQITLESGKRFTLSSGLEVGRARWNGDDLLTEEEAIRAMEAQKKQAQRQALVAQARAIDFSSLTDKRLKAILAIVTEQAVAEEEVKAD
jgi:hypothetical protein